jgi:hypothetical protein
VTVPAGKTPDDFKKAATSTILKAVTDPTFLKALLRTVLPQSLWGLIDSLVEAMVASTRQSDATASPSPSPKPATPSPSPSPKPAYGGYGGVRTRRF